MQYSSKITEFFLRKFIEYLYEKLKIVRSDVLHSIDLGLVYKTKGFLPEELYLEKHLGIRMGSTIRI